MELKPILKISLISSLFLFSCKDNTPNAYQTDASISINENVVDRIEADSVILSVNKKVGANNLLIATGTISGDKRTVIKDTVLNSKLIESLFISESKKSDNIYLEKTYYPFYSSYVYYEEPFVLHNEFYDNNYFYTGYFDYGIYEDFVDRYEPLRPADLAKPSVSKPLEPSVLIRTSERAKLTENFKNEFSSGERTSSGNVEKN